MHGHGYRRRCDGRRGLEEPLSELLSLRLLPPIVAPVAGASVVPAVAAVAAVVGGAAVVLEAVAVVGVALDVALVAPTAVGTACVVAFVGGGGFHRKTCQARGLKQREVLQKRLPATSLEAVLCSAAVEAASSVVTKGLCPCGFCAAVGKTV